ncbi:SpoIID/LytB domain-containing protein [Neobacillus sp. OS1-33]|uniref:SpoIID/LytB domain-containing protein n=1 Tax=Neobacillus sp. OS1-33 TaxID=3070683 RepID=UPI0027E1BC2E|nr:SpoIID/LytB domain-containing protein [Neobacillus sp. OS1-33]WML24578.1 SpoIID/LytB domain-containing protein [Neobacillus sp. OS1-33]
MKKLLIYLIVFVVCLGMVPSYKKAETIATEPQVQVKLRNYLGNQSSISLNIVGSYYLNGDSANLLTSERSYLVKVENETLGLYDGTIKLASGSELSITPVKSNDHAVINNREYAGSFLLTVEDKQYVRPINTINLEDYVKSVVPYEMPALWPMEALKAQAVSARTYAYFRLNQVINDTTTFQVYGGMTSLHPRSSEAVDATEGEVLTYGGNVIDAVFSASNGGKTEKLFNVWYPKSLPYFQVQNDEYDTTFTWDATLHKQQIDVTSLDLKNPDSWWDSSNEIDAMYANNIKKWMMSNLSGLSGKQIKIIAIPKVSFYEPTESGRFSKSNLSLDFFVKDVFNSNGELELQTVSINNQLADNMRWIISSKDLRSNLFSINETNDAFVFSGSGWGHGVGLSQYGANHRAAAGILYKDILSFYYPGTVLNRQYDNIKPVISGATSKTIYVNTTFDPRAGVTAMDNSDGDVTSTIIINGLVNSKVAGVYTLTYTVTDSSGNETNVTRQITVKLASPANLKAVASTYNSVNLSWSAVSGASGYEIYRSTSSTGTYTKIASTSSTSYRSTSLNTGTAYYYKVRAYQTVTPLAYSGYSSVVSAKPVLATPSSPKAASSAYNSIKTSWTAVSGASGYEVYRATSSTGSYYYAGSTTSTSYNNSGLVTNKPYYYKIRAYRMVGSTKVYSNFSAVVFAKPLPSVPTNFKAARVSSTSFKLTWSAIAGASGYELYRATSSSGAYTLLKRTTSLYYTNSGLIRGRTYYYKLRAYRMVGITKVYSGWTTIISVKP